jgi:hypothetical protein
MRAAIAECTNRQNERLGLPNRNFQAAVEGRATVAYFVIGMLLVVGMLRKHRRRKFHNIRTTNAEVNP